jgi:hypothetical protein
MMSRASRRSGLLAALILWFAAVSQAGAEPGNSAALAKSETDATGVAIQTNTKSAAPRTKKHAHRKSDNPASRLAAEKKPGAATSDVSQAMPPSVANAQAELQSKDTPLGNAARAMSARASTILASAGDKPAVGQSAEVVAADQLNDVDLALKESPPAKSLMVMAAADAPAASTPSVLARNEGSSAWEQTSPIGKIFIGFGALLTVASAARLFMA